MAARKGHGPAQARLGDLLFNGIEGLEPQPVEGLMWLTLSRKRVAGTGDEDWVTELLNRAMSVATPEQRAEAVKLADTLSPQFGGLHPPGRDQLATEWIPASRFRGQRPHGLFVSAARS